jgi:L-ascorbate metabolism protein UlaG (beta-lactamase superfamily)
VDIVWLGGHAFRISEGGRTVVTDPPDSESARGAHIVTASHSVPPHVDGAFSITGPGEYEVRDVFVVGVATPGLEENGGRNTSYCLSMGELTVCHLGALGGPLTEAHREAIGSIDVLMLPITGPPGVSPETAVELVNDLEPSLVIPIHGVGQGRLAQFLREMAAEEAEPAPQLTVSPIRLPDEAEVRVLVPRPPNS